MPNTQSANSAGEDPRRHERRSNATSAAISSAEITKRNRVSDTGVVPVS